jgi:hypothetical protein
MVFMAVFLSSLMVRIQRQIAVHVNRYSRAVPEPLWHEHERQGPCLLGSRRVYFHRRFFSVFAN